MEMTATSVLVIAILFFGGLFPKFEKHKILKWFFICVVLLSLCNNLIKNPDSRALEIYTYAILVFVSQISLRGRAFWSRRIGWTSVSEVTPEIRQNDFKFLAIALVTMIVGGLLLVQSGSRLIVQQLP